MGRGGPMADEGAEVPGADDDVPLAPMALATLPSKRWAAMREAAHTLWGDVRDLFYLALPIVLTSVAQMAMEMVSVAAAGRLGVPELDACGVARTLANCTGIAPLMGLAMAMDTLATQAFGAANHHLVGHITQRASGIIVLVSLPIIALWWSAAPILTLLKQDPTIVPLAQTYLRWFSAGLIPRALSEVAFKYLQAQGVVYPTLLLVMITFAFHFLATYLLVWPLGLGYAGVPIALVLSYTVQLLLCVAHVRLSPVWPARWKVQDAMACWGGWSRQAFQDWATFLKLGVPSAVQFCLDWSAFELVLLQSGMLGIHPLAAANVSTQLLTLLYMAPLGLAVATSVRVGQLLGSGRFYDGRRTARIAILSMALLATANSLTVLTLQPLFSRTFTPDPLVAGFVETLRLPVAGLVWFDAMSCGLVGVLRGVGLQAWGAGFNLCGQWVVGLPLATCMAFLWGLGVRGLYLGLMTGVGLVPVLDGLLLARVDWARLAALARRRSSVAVERLPPLAPNDAAAEKEKEDEEEEEEGGCEP